MFLVEHTHLQVPTLISKIENREEHVNDMLKYFPTIKQATEIIKKVKQV